jgi:nucleotide-binding universal stress UspA family protein
VETKVIPKVTDVADTILSEGEAGGYHTVVLGRRGMSGLSRFFMGSVTNKVINHGTNIAVCVVE